MVFVPSGVTSLSSMMLIFGMTSGSLKHPSLSPKSNNGTSCGLSNMIVYAVALGSSIYDMVPNIINNSIFVPGMVCSVVTS